MPSASDRRCAADLPSFLIITMPLCIRKNGTIMIANTVSMKLRQSEIEELAAKIEALTAELKAANAENEKLKAKLADASLGDVLSDVTEVAGIKVLAANVPNLDMNGLRNFCDKMKAKLSDCVVVLASVIDGKVNLVAAASYSAMAKGAHAGNLIKEIASLVGGGGGGRPNMAQAGGKDPSGVDACIAKAKEVAVSQLS